MAVEKIPKIKDLFLRSGIPLEVSTISELKKIGIEDHGEITYERDGKIFSTDIDGYKEFTVAEGLDLAVNFAIECKYKERNHNWIFMEFPESDLGVREDSNNQFFGDFFKKSLENKNKKLTKEYWEYNFRRANLFNLPTVGKGVDVFGSQFDDHVILEAMTQAVFGATKSHYENVDMVCDMLEDDRTINLVLSLPIVVTTASIFKIKNNTSLEEIETSDLSELLEETKGVLYYHTNDSNLEPFVSSLIKNNPLTLDNKSRKLREWDSDRNAINYIHPGYVYIVNYYNLKECFTTCMDYIQNIVDDLKKYIV